MLTIASGPRGVSAWAKSPGQIAVTYLRIALISTTHMYWASVVWLLMLGPGGVGMNEGGLGPQEDPWAAGETGQWRLSWGAQLLPAALRPHLPACATLPPPHTPCLHGQWPGIGVLRGGRILTVDKNGKLVPGRVFGLLAFPWLLRVSAGFSR